MNVSLKQLFFEALETLSTGYGGSNAVSLAVHISDYIENIVLGGDADEWREEYHDILVHQAMER